MTAPGERIKRPPTAVRLEEEGVSIDWPDGHRSLYPHRFLRAQCPCAHCIEEMTGRRLVFFQDIDPAVRALDWMEVGTYALAFLYSDAHDTGIYPFDLLRSLCQCSEHRAAP